MTAQKQERVAGADCEGSRADEISAEAVAESLYTPVPNASIWASEATGLSKGRRKKSGKSKRCQICDVPVSVVLACIKQCKCEGVFCSKHRLPEEHNCNVDFKGKMRSEPSAAPTKVRAI